MDDELPFERAVADFVSGASAEASFELIFRHYHPAIERFFARYGVAPEDRRDLTQETFYRIYTGRSGFRGEARFTTWVFTIAANVYRKYLRSKSAGKRAAKELSLDGTKPEDGLSLTERLVSADGPDPEGALLTNEQTKRILAAFEALPERMRECLRLRIFHDLPYGEIAVVMNISTETVRSNLFQARRRLRKLLDDSGFLDLDASDGGRG